MLRILSLLVCAAASAGAVTLYDAASGNPPAFPAWIASVPSGAVQTMGSGYVNLDTTSNNSVQAGYSPLSLPSALNLATGFTFTFDVRVNSESHASTNRAGFSFIAISSSLLGIEVGFWEDEVWVQDDGIPLFTHAEGAAIDTTAGLIRYALAMSSTGYSLTANGAPLLTGNLRNYSTFGPPYSLPNFVFLGDDTTSAQASFDLAYVDLSEVPEPEGLWLEGLGVAAILARRLLPY